MTTAKKLAVIGEMLAERGATVTVETWGKRNTPCLRVRMTYGVADDCFEQLTAIAALLLGPRGNCHGATMADGSVEATLQIAN